MSAQAPLRLAAKLFAAPDPRARVDLEPAIAVFHRFIQEGTLPGLLLDVADYRHVPEGPGVLLVGHDVDYGMDETGGELGLLATRKRNGDLDTEGLVRDTLRRALVAAKAIQDEGSLGLRFDLGAPLLLSIDRLHAPNRDEAAQALEQAAVPVIEKLYPGGARVERAHAEDPRKTLALRIRSEDAAPADELIGRLGG